MSEVNFKGNRHMNTDKKEFTRQWIQDHEKLEEAETKDNEEILDDAESLIVESSDDDYDSNPEEEIISTQQLGTPSRIVPSEMSSITESLKELFNSVNSIQTVGNVKIENSTGVHIGNITNINGNIQIIHTGGKISVDRSNSNNNNRGSRCRRRSTPQHTTFRVAEKEERADPDAFLQSIKFRVPKGVCSIVPRHSWLAQMPMEDYQYLPKPVKYVIISHTATECSEKQAINIRLIRDIQCFHIESRGWDDIAYNFLIGCDGNAYEGRGWGVVGAHTRGYNVMSIGVSFIGCFMRTLPNAAALNMCQNLLKRGVEEGHLAADYKLICHCQCSPTESPGRKLFELIQTWEHFYDIQNDVDEDTLDSK